MLIAEASLPITPELALRAHEGTPHHGNYGHPADAQEVAARQHTDLLRYNIRYAAGNLAGRLSESGF